MPRVRAKQRENRFVGRAALPARCSSRERKKKRNKGKKAVGETGRQYAWMRQGAGLATLKRGCAERLDEQIDSARSVVADINDFHDAFVSHR